MQPSESVAKAEEADPPISEQLLPPYFEGCLLPSGSGRRILQLRTAQ